MLKLKNYLPILLIIIVLAAYFASLGSWQIFKEAIYGSAFDSLAQNLLEFKAEVDAKAIGTEAMIIDGKYFMYYGPFPALLRIILNWLKPENYGNWTCFSKLLAYFISVVFFARITLLALNNNSKLDTKHKTILANFSITAFALASPVFYLIIHNTIYSDSTIWALCFSVLTIYYFLKSESMPLNDNLLNLTMMALCVGLTMLSKLTFALPLYFLLGYKVLKDKVLIRPKLMLSLIPLIILISFQLWYNHERFGKWLKVYDTEARSINAHIPARVRARALSFFDIKRIPQALAMYCGINTKKLADNKFPYIKTYRNDLDDINKYEVNAPIFPLTLSSTFLLITSLIGLIAILRRREALVPVLCLGLQVVFLLSFRVVCNRYLAETLPLMVYLNYFYLLHLPQFKQVSTWSLIYLAKVLILVVNSYCSLFSSINRTAEFDRSLIERLRAQSFFGDERARDKLQHILEIRKTRRAKTISDQPSA